MTVVYLNVGGQSFATTISTMNYDPLSMLARMVSDCWELQKASDGKVLFIDRDPTFFSYVLNYLRDGPNVLLPNDESELLKLRAEAEFYQLGGLKQMLAKCLKHVETRKCWIPKVGDCVQWKENMVECFLPFFNGFMNGFYMAPFESMIIKRKPNDKISTKRYRIIDTGSTYEIKARQYECFVCNEPAYLKIIRRSITGDKWISNEDNDDADYQQYKSRCLMHSVEGEIEEIQNTNCAVVKWINSGPVFLTAFVNDRGNVQKCSTRTTKFHVPICALKPKRC